VGKLVYIIAVSFFLLCSAVNVRPVLGQLADKCTIEEIPCDRDADGVLDDCCRCNGREFACDTDADGFNDECCVSIRKCRITQVQCDRDGDGIADDCCGRTK